MLIFFMLSLPESMSTRKHVYPKACLIGYVNGQIALLSLSYGVKTGG